MESGTRCLAFVWSVEFGIYLDSGPWKLERMSEDRLAISGHVPHGTGHLQMRPSLFASALALLFFRFCPVPDQPGFLVCGFHWITGRPCPLCGMTRALSFLAKGEWTEAMRFHPLSPIVLGILCGTFVAGMVHWLAPEFSWRFIPASFRNRFWAGCALLFVGYGVIRFFFGPWF